MKACLTLYRETILSLYDIVMSEALHPDFQALAEMRYQIRRFVRFSENAARNAGIEPQQQQLLLAVAGLPDGLKPTIRNLAARMQLRHHSTVGLVDRLVERGLLIRLKATDDKRQVLIRLTRSGEETLSSLARYHSHEIRSAGPQLLAALQRLIGHHGRLIAFKNHSNAGRRHG